MKKNAVVLFSGGLDSTTCVAMAMAEGFNVYALTINYGQKHCSEIEAARKIAKKLGVTNHLIIDLPLSLIGGSSLHDKSMAIPDAGSTTGIPSTYVPARNTIFLSIALGYAEVNQASDIYIGVSSVDYSGYPDCRPEYLAAFETLAALATKEGVNGRKFKIHTPLVVLSKAQTLEAGIRLGVDYSMTVSCYRADSEGRACGNCDSCALRKKGFQDAGMSDVTRYASQQMTSV
ncbi:MAG: 7-cyano-7-deazaguanine synthase QueC [Legionellales bacterium]|nr:7-cyano-7-deazaguanine synthase QueC [Legionellales bacterium]